MTGRAAPGRVAPSGGPGLGPATRQADEHPGPDPFAREPRAAPNDRQAGPGHDADLAPRRVK